MKANLTSPLGVYLNVAVALINEGGHVEGVTFDLPPPEFYRVLATMRLPSTDVPLKTVAVTSRNPHLSWAKEVTPEDLPGAEAVQVPDVSEFTADLMGVPFRFRLAKP